MVPSHQPHSIPAGEETEKKKREVHGYTDDNQFQRKEKDLNRRFRRLRR
jgi:hypothetical protein